MSRPVSQRLAPGVEPGAGGARLAEGVGGQGGVGTAHGVGVQREHAGEVEQHAVGGPAGAAPGVGGQQGGDEQGRRPADERVLPAGELPAGRARQGDDEHRLQPGLRDQQGTAVEGHREQQGDADDEADLPGTGAHGRHEGVADGHPDGHADGELGDPAQPLGGPHAEADDGGDAGEERPGVAEQDAGQLPGQGGGDGALRDRPAGRHQPLAGGGQRGPHPLAPIRSA